VQKREVKFNVQFRAIFEHNLDMILSSFGDGICCEICHVFVPLKLS
jgi:hypothetical protein